MSRGTPPRSTWWSWAPGSPACTCSTGSGARASRRGCSRRATASAAPGTGTATRARAATSRAWSTPTRSPRSCSRSGSGPSATPPQPEILRYANHVADRFDLRRDIQLRDPGHRRPTSTRRRARWHVDAPTAATTSPPGSASWPPAAFGANDARHPGRRRVHGADLPHRPLAARGRRLHRPARRRDRHRLVGDPVDPASSPSRRPQLTVFQRTANFTVPARNEPLDPSSVKPRSRPTTRRSAPRTALSRRSGFGAATASGDKSALERGRARSGEREFERRWADGGARRSSAPTPTCSSTTAANELAAEFVRGKIRAIVDDPETAEAAVPDQDPDRLQAPLRRHRLLRHVQPAPRAPRRPARDADRGASRRPASAPTAPSHELDAIVFATGFDAMTGALAPHRHHRARWPLAAGRLVGRTAHLPRAAASAGFPNLFTITGPGSPSVLTNMIVSHRAARRVDRRLHRPPRRATAAPRSRPTLDAAGRRGWST